MAYDYKDPFSWINIIKDFPPDKAKSVQRYLSMGCAVFLFWGITEVFLKNRASNDS